MEFSRFGRKIICLGLFLLACNLLLITNVFAQTPVKQFSSSYNVIYDVDTTGLTEVTEQVSLKNLTDKFFASNFVLNIPASQITDVQASDSAGPLEVEAKPAGNKTQINVKFATQVLGKDKEYKWNLKFKSKDFAQNIGKVWQVTIPKVATITDIDSYNLTLSVPVDFGDPTSISPSPAAQSENGNKIAFIFKKNQLIDSGVSANFGTNQYLKFSLGYNLTNNNIFPTILKLTLPPDTTAQKVLITSLTPKPENVTLDQDGNFIAWFKVDRKQTLPVTVQGLSKLSFGDSSKITALSSSDRANLTSQQKYWEKDNPAIKTKLAEILKSKPTKNRDKVRLINQFVEDNLKFDTERLRANDFQRLGSVTALSNSTKALSAEFTDLFIALTRAANIPARQLIGFGLSNNRDLRPLSYAGVNLHTWPEYFDENLGWVMVDPTWASTAGGVDYFSKFDLDHFAISINGQSSANLKLPDIVKVEATEDLFEPKNDLRLTIEAPNTSFAGFPLTAKIKVENLGNVSTEAQELFFTTSKISIVGSNHFAIPKLPAQGKFEYEFELRSDSPWASYQDILQLKVGEQSISKTLQIKPFFEYKYFGPGVILLIIFMISIYILTLVTHIRKYRRPATKKSA